MNTDSGHGHVFPRADGAKARCGGPVICPACAKDAAWALQHMQTTPPAPQSGGEREEFEKYFKDGGYQYSDSNKVNAHGWWEAGWQSALASRNP